MQSEWININEQNPIMPCLVYLANDQMFITKQLVTVTENQEKTYYYPIELMQNRRVNPFIPVNRITHWMTLPQPPKERMF